MSSKVIKWLKRQASFNRNPNKSINNNSTEKESSPAKKPSEQKRRISFAKLSFRKKKNKSIDTELNQSPHHSTMGAPDTQSDGGGAACDTHSSLSITKHSEESDSPILDFSLSSTASNSPGHSTTASSPTIQPQNSIPIKDQASAIANGAESTCLSFESKPEISENIHSFDVGYSTDKIVEEKNLSSPQVCQVSKTTSPSTELHSLISNDDNTVMQDDTEARKSLHCDKAIEVAVLRSPQLPLTQDATLDDILRANSSVVSMFNKTANAEPRKAKLSIQKFPEENTTNASDVPMHTKEITEIEANSCAEILSLNTTDCSDEEELEFIDFEDLPLSDEDLGACSSSTKETESESEITVANAQERSNPSTTECATVTSSPTSSMDENINEVTFQKDDDTDPLPSEFEADIQEVKIIITEPSPKHKTPVQTNASVKEELASLADDEIACKEPATVNFEESASSPLKEPTLSHKEDILSCDGELTKVTVPDDLLASFQEDSVYVPVLSDSILSVIQEASVTNKEDSDVNVITSSNHNDIEILDQNTFSHVFPEPLAPVLIDSSIVIHKIEDKKMDDYPVELNPFGEDDDLEDSQKCHDGSMCNAGIDTTNPFGSDDEDDDLNEDPCEYRLKNYKADQNEVKPVLHSKSPSFYNEEVSVISGSNGTHDSTESDRFSPTNPFAEDIVQEEGEEEPYHQYVTDLPPRLPPKSDINTRRRTPPSCMPVPRPRKTKQSLHGSFTSLQSVPIYPVPAPRTLTPTSSTKNLNASMGEVSDDNGYFQRSSYERASIQVLPSSCSQEDFRRGPIRCSVPANSRVRIAKKKRPAPLPPHAKAPIESKSRGTPPSAQNTMTEGNDGVFYSLPRSHRASTQPPSSPNKVLSYLSISRPPPRPPPPRVGLSDNR